jgi:hypothetical protein
MSKEISTKSPKNEILAAYNELLAKVKEQKTTDRKTEKLKDEEAKIVGTATQNTAENIVKALGNVKLESVKMLDQLGERLFAELKKLTDLQQAIDIESNRLDEIFEIKVTTDSLAALLLAQKEKKAAFEMEMEEKKKLYEEEMNQKKLLWKQEQESYDLQKKEREVQVKKERQREEEEYNYAQQLKRKKDNDLYEARKAELEKELTVREAALATREKELVDLKARVEAFPSELEKAIKETERSVKEKLEFNYKHQAELASKDIESERKLTKQMITSFETKIKEQEDLIHQLTHKASEAVSQVQSIAIKAIEGASAQRVFSGSHEKSSESTKG